MAVVGHRSSGKTQLCELLLAAAGAVREQGRVDEGTSLLDASPEARRHRQTVELSSFWLEVEGRTRAEEGSGCLVQVLDTPGASGLAATRDLAMESVEAAVLVVDAVHGVQIGTEECLAVAAACGLPVLAVVCSADRGVPEGLPAELASASQMRPVVLQFPVLEGGRLVGLVDVLGDRMLRYADDGSGAFSPEPIPAGLASERMLALERLAEAVAVTDDALLEHYLEFFELPLEMLRSGLAAAVRSRRILPVLHTSALLGIGGQPVLDAIAEWVPSLEEAPRILVEEDGSSWPLDPAGPFLARVLSEQVDPEGATWHLLRVFAGHPPKGDWFGARTGDRFRVRKLYRIRGPRRAAAHDLFPGAILGTWDPLPAPAGTTLTDGSRAELAWATRPRAPMLSRAVGWLRPRDPARARPLLEAVVRADAGLTLAEDPWTGALLLSGCDEAHLRLARERLQRLGAEIDLRLPPVGYVEVPARPVRGVEGLHRKLDGDGLAEEFGRCLLDLDPVDPAVQAGLEDRIGPSEEDLPLRFRPAVEEGIRAALRHGPTAGYPVMGAAFALVGGDYDLLQSTEAHFLLAGQRAARTALERSGTRLHEPWWEVAVDCPAASVGDVISDISAHRGRILGMEVDGPRARVSASCPYRELRLFGPRLQELSGGRASFVGRHSHHEPLPAQLLAEAVESSPHRPAATDVGHPSHGGSRGAPDPVEPSGLGSHLPR